ncbi:MAG: hypothetical protein A3J46_06655 [Candidatus Yanofskybacteria bacterium RIFCSPHIGHO2_02_FULL_41_11]|uniref:Chromosomal replication initiator protein DnaA n=1 Tax=Candidatus Yanofskybacteria bacterium RIFCSPHIGHO2_02_FULL_41_11 TaxID=1802675 RepID=A0A1F8F9E5_9BACT|nr:MAG: hypothetical protein A3J46_06655 [Candidatus Yanofskybacteria bacterium RIFCSPHIGHO2_02_FULL_41_11]
MPVENAQLWKLVLSDMESSLSRANFTTWFKNTSIISSNNDSIFVSVPNGFAKEWLENKFNKQILQKIREVAPHVRDVRYVIGDGVQIKPSLLQQRNDIAMIPDRMLEDKQENDVDKITNLNKRYTFDSFVVGSNNELAHAASVAIVKNPGRSYNPLFLYGGVGLGKTHLLQATGNELSQVNPSKKILYMSAEKMTANIVEAIKNRTIEDLKQHYAKLDVLIVDDVQFMAGKEKTQEIFFSTFNELYEKNKQIILSSDRAPKAIPALEKRIMSRFEGGMIADIGSPDHETRLAILKTKAKEKNFDIDNESLSYIASNIQKNIRELEGALNRIIAFSQIYNKTPSLNEIKKLLATYLSTPFRKTTVQAIIKCVSDFYGIPLVDITKKGRKKEIVKPRQIAMFLLREEMKLSFPEIGSKVGGRDHSTVIHAYNKIKKEEDQNETTKQELTLIKERLYQSFESA